MHTMRKKIEYPYKIYEQIHINNCIPFRTISQNTGISRNTVSKYLDAMYEQKIIQGPHISINPAQNYAQYVYLMQFQNPYTAFERLNGFPHVVYYALLFGDWNILVITDTLLDLSQLVGVKKNSVPGKKGKSETTKAQLTTWKKCQQKARMYIENFEFRNLENTENVPVLPWGSEEWKLYFAFCDNLRKKKTPVLKEIDVRYEKYTQWENTLDVYCTRHVAFFPKGVDFYDHHCFVVSTDYKEQLKHVFSHFPTTTFFMDVGEYVLLITSVAGADITRWLYCMVNTMEIMGIINNVWYAQFLFYNQVKTYKKGVKF